MNINKYYIAGTLSKPYNDFFRKYGPIKAEQVQKQTSPSPEWTVISHSLTRSPIGLIDQPRPNTSAGCSIYFDRSLNSAVGEALERYNAKNSHCLENFVVKPYLSEEMPFKFCRCASFENCFESFKVHSLHIPIEHSRVKQLSTDSEYFIPAEYVHLGLLRENHSTMHTAPISTGCAFFTDQVTAIWKGICEVFERDAMMRIWLTKGKSRKIDFRNCNVYAIRERLKKITNAKADIKVNVFEISNAINIPTFFTVLESKEYPYYCVGASADTNLISACIKSIDEAMSIRTFAIENAFKAEMLDFARYEWVDHLEAHLQLYANWKDTDAFSFLFDTTNFTTFDDLSASCSWLETPQNMDELRAICSAIEKKTSWTILYKDITMEEIKPFGFVTKVIVPEAIPLSQAHNTRWIAGITNSDRIEINPLPHPFA